MTYYVNCTKDSRLHCDPPPLRRRGYRTAPSYWLTTTVDRKTRTVVQTRLTCKSHPIIVGYWLVQRPGKDTLRPEEVVTETESPKSNRTDLERILTRPQTLRWVKKKEGWEESFLSQDRVKGQTKVEEVELGTRVLGSSTKRVILKTCSLGQTKNFSDLIVWTRNPKFILMELGK